MSVLWMTTFWDCSSSIVLAQELTINPQPDLNEIAHERAVLRLAGGLTAVPIGTCP